MTRGRPTRGFCSCCWRIVSLASSLRIRRHTATGRRSDEVCPGSGKPPERAWGGEPMPMAERRP